MVAAILSGAALLFWIFSTKMYCEGVQQREDAFFKQLGKVNRFVIKDKALLLYMDKEVLLEFEGE